MLINISRQPKVGSPGLVELLIGCHDRIRRFVDLAHRLGNQPDAPTDEIVQACIDVERYFKQALPLHVVDEEESVEPRLRGLNRRVDNALDTMARQHEEHGPELTRLLQSVFVLKTNPNRIAAHLNVATSASVLQRHFEEHLKIEENEIFPAIEEHLSPESQRTIISELRERRRNDLRSGTSNRSFEGEET